MGAAHRYKQTSMEITNIPAIILAGGLGTRLKEVVKDLPKPMAPVNGKPFLHYVFEYLNRQGITRAVLAVGYKYEVIKAFLGNSYLNIDIQYSIEEEPLGTGGAIKQAFDLVEDEAFVINGDTFFDVSLSELYSFFSSKNADLAMALKQLKNFDRYGTVKVNDDERVVQFKEKKLMEEGLINGGVYLMKKNIFNNAGDEKKFSFEKDVLEKFVGELRYYGISFENYFIDIGIPTDYAQAQIDFI